MSSHTIPPLLEGKSLIIILVIVISGLSFTLGYFVGKKNSRFGNKEIVEVRKKGTDFQPPASEQESHRTAERTIKKDIQKARNVNTAKQDIAVLGNSSKAKTIKPTNNNSNFYTVQVGAFKRLKEADNLKSLLEKKGYNSYIETADARRGKLYKVRVGKFNTRDQAEEVTEDIKKMKGLDAFTLISR